MTTSADTIAYTLTTSKPFDKVVADIQTQTAEHKFRVLHIHDVQATLAEKGFSREPLKIIEVCNAGFAHEALGKEIDVALMMPCKFTVRTDGSRTTVTLGRPTVISQLFPDAGLEKLAAEVETTLKTVMTASV